MYKIKYTGFILICIISIACTVSHLPYVPEPYKVDPGELGSNPYGSWIEVTYMQAGITSSMFASGELLAMGKDSMYVLLTDGTVYSLDTASITTAFLCTHKNQSGRYFKLTMAYSIPSIIGALAHADYAGSFFALNIPLYITGLVHTLTESNSDNNFLIYPEKNDLIQFKAYARYPAGLPDGIDLSQLSLKKI